MKFIIIILTLVASVPMPPVVPGAERATSKLLQTANPAGTPNILQAASSHAISEVRIPNAQNHLVDSELVNRPIGHFTPSPETVPISVVPRSRGKDVSNLQRAAGRNPSSSLAVSSSSSSSVNSGDSLRRSSRVAQAKLENEVKEKLAKEAADKRFDVIWPMFPGLTSKDVALSAEASKKSAKRFKAKDWDLPLPAFGERATSQGLNPEFEKVFASTFSDANVKSPGHNSNLNIDRGHSLRPELPATNPNKKQKLDTGSIHLPNKPPSPPRNFLTTEELNGLHNLGFTKEETLAIDPIKFQAIKERMPFSLDEKNVDESKKAMRQAWIELNLE